MDRSQLSKAGAEFLALIKNEGPLVAAAQLESDLQVISTKLATLRLWAQSRLAQDDSELMSGTIAACFESVEGSLRNACDRTYEALSWTGAAYQAAHDAVLLMKQGAGSADDEQPEG